MEPAAESAEDANWDILKVHASRADWVDALRRQHAVKFGATGQVRE